VDKRIIATNANIIFFLREKKGAGDFSVHFERYDGRCFEILHDQPVYDIKSLKVDVTASGLLQANYVITDESGKDFSQYNTLPV
jgi:hypothetical protein